MIQVITRLTGKADEEYQINFVSKDPVFILADTREEAVDYAERVGALEIRAGQEIIPIGAPDDIDIVLADTNGGDRVQLAAHPEGLIVMRENKYHAWEQVSADWIADSISRADLVRIAAGEVDNSLRRAARAALGIDTLYSYVSALHFRGDEAAEGRYYTAFGADAASIEEQRAEAREMALEPVARGSMDKNVSVYCVDAGVYLASGPSWTMVSEGPVGVDSSDDPNSWDWCTVE